MPDVAAGAKPGTKGLRDAARVRRLNKHKSDDVATGEQPEALGKFDLPAGAAPVAAPKETPIAAEVPKTPPGLYGAEGDDWVYEVHADGGISVRNTATGKSPVALKAGSPEYKAVSGAIAGTQPGSDKLTRGGGASGKPSATAPSGTMTLAPDLGTSEQPDLGTSEQPDLGTSKQPDLGTSEPESAFAPARMHAAVREAVAETTPPAELPGESAQEGDPLATSVREPSRQEALAQAYGSDRSHQPLNGVLRSSIADAVGRITAAVKLEMGKGKDAKGNPTSLGEAGRAAVQGAMGTYGRTS